MSTPSSFGAKSYFYTPVQSGPKNPWKTTAISRLPIPGFAALLGALLGVVASIAILMGSNGQPTQSWSLQPTVYLAVASAVTNIALHFALTEGVTVAWWRRASEEDTSIGDLHRHWSYGNSLWAAVTSGRHINMVAIASIFVAIGPINGPLLQRASRVTFGQFNQDTDVSIKIAQRLPDGYTGMISGRAHRVAMLTSDFTKIVNAANSQADISIGETGCTGKCATTLRGAGFAVSCSESTMPFSLNLDTKPGQIFDNNHQAMKNGTNAFGTSFRWDVYDEATMYLGVQFKSTQACDGDIQLRNCTLQSAVVDYPVIVNGNKSTIELDAATTMFDDVVQDLTSLAINTMTGPTTMGGFHKALTDTYESMANIRYAGAVGYQLETTGATVNRYAVLSPDIAATSGGHGGAGGCNLSFTDPSNDLIKAMRDMMFRTAIAAANDSDLQTVTARETSTLPIYQSHYLYLGLAILCTALGWFTTLPIFIGWWHVGRTISMSPIETAKAFNAPMLANGDSNADADALLREVGERAVRYGAVAATGSQLDRLELCEPHFIRKPHPGQTFVG